MKAAEILVSSHEELKCTFCFKYSSMNWRILFTFWLLNLLAIDYLAGSGLQEFFITIYVMDLTEKTMKGDA